MKLHLIRHGKTNYQSESGNDFDRKLRNKGEIQAVQLGKYLKDIIKVEYVFCSSAARTVQTLELVSENTILPNIVFSDDLYLSPLASYLKLIWELKGENDVLLVGHNFGISDLVTYFTDELIEMKTAEYICIDFGLDSWKETSRGLGTISARYRPSASLDNGI